ncbi:hypothetical protein P154DRAFT_574641 [Amniculicola lignicola CBS 123094]|uniref:Uncharacterized protein n=1 Tax=Amniculicola lignicola CBS 123094 TaxID=1392246 RepID=A0A6A5WJW9_9PLEO|nr:hypothetical protein P154DRAFT_574641 [Amniculicola lignicola CBS 123094]
MSNVGKHGGTRPWLPFGYDSFQSPQRVDDYSLYTRRARSYRSAVMQRGKENVSTSEKLKLSWTKSQGMNGRNGSTTLLPLASAGAAGTVVEDQGLLLSGLRDAWPEMHGQGWRRCKKALKRSSLTSTQTQGSVLCGTRRVQRVTVFRSGAEKGSINGSSNHGRVHRHEGLAEQSAEFRVERGRGELVLGGTAAWSRRGEAG